MSGARVTFRLRSWWHAGTGRGEASTVDALVVRDVDGLPCLPGRTVRGLLRDALAQWEYWEQPLGQTAARDALTTWLLGRRTAASAGLTRYDVNDGRLRVASARLPELVRERLAGHPQRDALITEMTHVLRSTAIEEASGVAKPKSLRAMEVAVPVELVCEVNEDINPQDECATLVDGSGHPVDWIAALERASGFLRAVGMHRHRGLGRVEVEIRGPAPLETGVSHG